MQSEPRIPIEVDRQPVFRTGPSLGCSAIALAAIVTVAVFYFLFTQVTPKWVAGGVKAVSGIFNSASPTLAVALASSTPQATERPSPTPTPQGTAIKASYVQVVNTGGVGVRLRHDPQQNATTVTALLEGTIVQIIGPDQTNANGTWANVRTLDGNGDIGWISRKYLMPAQAP